MSPSNPFRPSWRPADVNAPAPTSLTSADSLARAEAALKALAGQFARWLRDEIDKLEAARARVATEGLSGDAGEALYITAHDLKGLGGTYEFPIVSRIAASLCALLEDADKRPARPLDLIDAHIEAIKAMVRDDIREDLHPLGGATVIALENRARAIAG